MVEATEFRPRRTSSHVPLLVLILCGSTAAYFLHGRRQSADPVLLPLPYFLSGLGLAAAQIRIADQFDGRGCERMWFV